MLEVMRPYFHCISCCRETISSENEALCSISIDFQEAHQSMQRALLPPGLARLGIQGKWWRIINMYKDVQVCNRVAARTHYITLNA